MSMAYLMLWPVELRSTYEYGCQVSVSPERVVTYHAPLMPPGEIIHEWRSHRNYPQEHLTSELPILRPGTTYHLEGNVTVTGGGIYLRIRFFDVNQQELPEVILDGTSGDFEMPELAVSYHVELVNTHHDQVIFRSLLLTDAQTFQDYTFTINQFLGTVVAQPEQASAPYVSLVVRQTATKPLNLVADRLNFITYVSPYQLGNVHWVDKINQELRAFLAQHPAASPEKSGLTAWQTKLRYWQSLLLREDQK